MMLFDSVDKEIILPNARLHYHRDFIVKSESDALFKLLLNKTTWRHDQVRVFGKIYDQPRLTALYSTTTETYSYAGLTMHPEPFPEFLIDIKKKVEQISHQRFNTLLLNLYRDGSDSNGWHADNEKELGKNPVIASISLGVERPFHFKHRMMKEERYKLILQHGSLLIMSGEMQHHWVHQIAKTRRVIGPRINLTFRTLVL